MDLLLLWGLDTIRTVQSAASPPLTFFMKGVTLLGSASAYMLFLPLVFWCLDEKKGVRLGITLMISILVNLILKFTLDQPRPFWEGWEPALGMVSERFNGFPSGHAQNSLVAGIIIASWGGKKRYYCLALFLSLLIGFSRIYLGVHFPTDLLGGWILGVLILAGYFLLGKRIEEALARGGPRIQRIAAGAAAFVMILYRPQAELLMPGAFVLSMGLGYNFTVRRLHFSAEGVFGRTGTAKLLTLGARFIAGIAGTILFLSLAGRLEWRAESPYYLLFYFFSLLLPGFWVYSGAPWLFQRLRLAEQGETEEVLQAE
ncbi:MAG: phosphatase PAP2 family protein [Treponema sp.]|jgi:membrane-associated phospholipid phosphatase|nr:phosphatase PAP2 family protein [Treponema sp.]